MVNWLLPTFFTVFCVIVLWFYLSKSKTKPVHKRQTTTTPVKKDTKSNRGISIHLCDHACEAINEVRNKRYYPSETPALPIYGCTNPNCRCTYIHHEDRRSGEDRRYPSIKMKGVIVDNDHRHKSDRRKQ